MPFLNLEEFYAAFRVCVDDASEGRLAGTVYSQRLTAPIVFRDVEELLLRVDRVLDKQNFPQAFQEGRSFTARESDIPAAECIEAGMPADAVMAARGRKASFDLYITSRRSASWQGRVEWPDGEKQSFGSALELVRLLEERIS